VIILYCDDDTGENKNTNSAASYIQD